MTSVMKSAFMSSKRNRSCCVLRNRDEPTSRLLRSPRSSWRLNAGNNLVSRPCSCPRKRRPTSGHHAVRFSITSAQESDIFNEQSAIGEQMLRNEGGTAGTTTMKLVEDLEKHLESRSCTSFST